MKLIVGLGNPGKKYEGTRHNAGFLALEYLRNEWGFPTFRENNSFQAECSEGRIGNEKIILTRPLTFMNDSGNAVQTLMHFYKIETNDLTVVHDDIDISLGSIRESFDSRSAGHNGVEDIIAKIGAKDFLRFRIGIRTARVASGDTSFDTAQFVLDAFPPEERALIGSLFPTLETRLRERVMSPTSSSQRP
jgi:PTH1 family peptidyl-tRNA hydrolase